MNISTTALRAGRVVRRWVALAVRGAVLAVSVASAGDGSASGEEEGRQWSVAARWENDIFGGTDRYYTGGVELSLAHTGRSWMDPVADVLPWGEGRRTVSYDLAQLIFTPAHTSAHVPDPDDRPYAGILSVGLTLHVERFKSYHGLKFTTGVVGPWSLAEETQNEVHRLTGKGQTRGWDYQLDNEPIFNFTYEYRHKFVLAGQRDAWSTEALPLVGGWLGNMVIQAQVGGILRAGYNMPNDFGPTLMRGVGQLPPPQRNANPKCGSDWGFSIFAGALDNVVLRDITLDGNTFQDSRSVDKYTFVPVIAVGTTIGNRHFQGSFTYMLIDEQFEGQKGDSGIGAVGLTYVF